MAARDVPDRPVDGGCLCSSSLDQGDWECYERGLCDHLFNDVAPLPLVTTPTIAYSLSSPPLSTPLLSSPPVISSILLLLLLGSTFPFVVHISLLSSSFSPLLLPTPLLYSTPSSLFFLPSSPYHLHRSPGIRHPQSACVPVLRHPQSACVPVLRHPQSACVSVLRHPQSACVSVLRYPQSACVPVHNDKR